MSHSGANIVRFGDFYAHNDDDDDDTTHPCASVQGKTSGHYSVHYYGMLTLQSLIILSIS